jgi:hypothetical protein
MEHEMRFSLNWGWIYSLEHKKYHPSYSQTGDGRDMITLLYILDYSVLEENYHLSVYKLFPSQTSTNALSSSEMRLIGESSVEARTTPSRR